MAGRGLGAGMSQRLLYAANVAGAAIEFGGKRRAQAGHVELERLSSIVKKSMTSGENIDSTYCIFIIQTHDHTFAPIPT